MGIERRYITKAEFSQSFVEASESFNYHHAILAKVNVRTGQSLLHFVARLHEKWNNDQCIDVYDNDSDRSWGRVKATDSKDDAGINWYLGFFHGRVEAWKNDPLIVISFRNEIIPAPDGFDKGFELAVIHAISDHNSLFGEDWEKTFPDHMRNKRKQNATILSFYADINQPDAEGMDEP